MVGSQFHPEFKSRPNRPHPLFNAFMAAAVDYQETRQPAEEAAGHSENNGQREQPVAESEA
jgi:CTP synthase